MPKKRLVGRKHPLIMILCIIFATIYLGVLWAADCTSNTCLQIETIRENYEADRYVFLDPNWGNAVGMYLADLDNKIAYMEGIQSYYPTQASWEAEVEALRQNYLFSLNSFISQAELLPGETSFSDEESAPASDGEDLITGGGGDSGSSATKRIVLTLANGNKYTWRYVPPSNGQSASLISEGRLEE